MKTLILRLLLFIRKVRFIRFKISGESVWSPGVDISICTIEKANSLMNKVIEEKVYFDISFFIIDEFHLVSKFYNDLLIRFWMNKEAINLNHFWRK